MKNTFLFIFLLLINVIYAQNDRREKLEFGVKFGLNISNVWDSQGESFVAKSKAGLNTGIFLGIPISKFIGLQPELQFSQKGFKGSGILLGNPYSFSKSTSYLDVPILVQIKPIEFLTIVAGPQFSYLFNEKNTYILGSNSILQEQEFNNQNIRKNILGFVAGIDCFYNFLVFSGRGGFDFQTNNSNGTSYTPRYKNRWIQFTIGIKI